MIKLISKDNPAILAFRVSDTMEKEDVAWLIKRVKERRELENNDIQLYVEFEDFGNVKFSIIWSHFKMFLDHLKELIRNVDKIATVTSNSSLREKLMVESALIPTVSMKVFDSNESSKAVQWLEEIN